jgi:hypothetical protein
MISSAVLNLKFLNELAASYDRNFKFTALGSAMRAIAVTLLYNGSVAKLAT